MLYITLYVPSVIDVIKIEELSGATLLSLTISVLSEGAFEIDRIPHSLSNEILPVAMSPFSVVAMME